jgi:hypothetical protein
VSRYTSEGGAPSCTSLPAPFPDHQGPPPTGARPDPVPLPSPARFLHLSPANGWPGRVPMIRYFPIIDNVSLYHFNTISRLPRILHIVYEQFLPARDTPTVAQAFGNCQSDLGLRTLSPQTSRLTSEPIYVTRSLKAAAWTRINEEGYRGWQPNSQGPKQNRLLRRWA